MAEKMVLGGKVRALRRRHGLTQAKMAERLQISPSYLNLIEHDKRPLTAPLLIKLVQAFDVDLADFSSDEDARLEGDLMEVFGDALFEEAMPTNLEVRELVSRSPTLARGVVELYRAYTSARQQAETLSGHVLGEGSAHLVRAQPTDEVTELVQRQDNYMPELEDAAEALWREARLEPGSLWSGLKRYLGEQGVAVRMSEQGAFGGAVRRYDPKTHTLYISEVLNPRSRVFQMAVQIGLLTQQEVLDRRAGDASLTTPESRTLMRMVLGGYFAGAVIMPYRRILEAAKATRYDIELLGHRFDASFEQICHRLSTLRKPGESGVPFHFIKLDPAGNVSKRFSASGFRFARFGGACPRWNVSRALLRPYQVRRQISVVPDGSLYFCVARTVTRRHGGHRAPETVNAVGLGCPIDRAPELIYADGFDFDNLEEVAEPIGTTCRLCARRDCDQRAFPSLEQPLTLNENVRGAGFYARVSEDDL